MNYFIDNSDLMKCEYCGFTTDMLDTCKRCGSIYCVYCSSEKYDCCKECEEDEEYQERISNEL